MVANATSPGIIVGEGDSVYTETEARQRLGLIGAHAWRAAKRRGLKVRRSGKRNFLLGSDIVDFIKSTARLVNEPEAVPA